MLASAFGSLMTPNPSPLLQVFLAERERIVRLLRRLVRSRATAEDLAQDAFLRLWGRALAGDSRSLLFRTAQNLAIDHLRSGLVQARHAETARREQTARPAPAPDQSAAAREEIAALVAALSALPDRARRAFLLNRLDGLSYTQIAAALGISVSTVEKDIIRALEVCRRGSAR
jgi:RNA polymerase sigma-70 factor (ECF subfamily)